MRTAVPLEERFWQYVAPTEGGCWSWKGTRVPFGYGRIMVKRGDKYLPEMAHRVSYRLHKGAIPVGMCVMHICDNPSCVNPEHLSVGTIAENNHDAKRKGRSRGLKGAAHHHASLTPEAVSEIRSSSAPQSALAEIFGVSQSAISLVRSGKRWACLEKETA